MGKQASNDRKAREQGTLFCYNTVVPGYRRPGNNPESFTSKAKHGGVLSYDTLLKGCQLRLMPQFGTILASPRVEGELSLGYV